jgi:hypothetical protein|tara:strand:+ start:113 stop:325 length:213 start_codon:yes stop_codon:yes gene_type:complete
MISFNGTEIKEGDSVTFISGRNERGAYDYEFGKVKSFSESGTLFVEIHRNKRITAIRQEELVNVKSEERK